MDIPFDCDSHIVNGLSLSFLDSLGEKPPLHLYHANGFPISTYLPLMTTLTSDFRVVGLGLRGQDAQEEGNTSWYKVADDLIHFLDAKNMGPVLGVGHSVGGVATMIAAAERPDLFSRIVLIDPVIASAQQIAGLLLLRITGRKKSFFLAKKARERKSTWKSRQEAYDYLKGKQLFKRFDDIYLRSYITYGFKPSTDGGVELLCPPEAEARIFENYPLDVWKWPGRLKIPVLIVRGQYSDVLSEKTVMRFCSLCSHSQSVAIRHAGHLIPMEQPNETIRVIKQFSESSPISADVMKYGDHTS